MERPEGKAQGTQRWHRLLFSHWEVPTEALEPLVHPRLSIDTFEGRAFVGVVAFQMQRVKPFGFGVPTATSFCEINVRTYVRLEGGERGVVFFSLDADSSLATLAARTLWRVPYHKSRIGHDDRGASVTWSCDRSWPGPAMRGFRAELDIGEPLPQPQPGSLEHFLVERYQFYTGREGEPLRRARVHHAPYPLQAVPRCDITQALVAGLPCGARTPDYFSPGVDVEMFGVERVP
jgi:uncharacterized protein YqjF (DUF2071 family)